MTPLAAVTLKYQAVAPAGNAAEMIQPCDVLEIIEPAFPGCPNQLRFYNWHAYLKRRLSFPAGFQCPCPMLGMMLNVLAPLA